MKIEAHGLTKLYGNNLAVNGIDLSVDNEVYGLLGPNGSGKTTTVSMLTTLLRPSSGSAEICGFDIQTQQSSVRECMSYVPQDMAVDVRLTGRENVDLFARLYGIRNKQERRRRVDEALEIMNLSDRADDMTMGYSGGMRRRLELAQALVHQPQVLFLDEPTVGLDVAARRSIWEYIVNLRNHGVTIFVTTHQMDEAERYCDRVGILKKGDLVNEGVPSDLTSSMKAVITVRTDVHLPISELPDGIEMVRDENGEIMVTADDGSEALPRMLELLSGLSIKVYSSTVREPTLEDVYLQSVGRTNPDNDTFNQKQFENMMRRR
ncbi:MAG: ATP-binding cassette domain-containing protein [Candidatus Methanomethylophilaceae archaeon]